MNARCCFFLPLILLFAGCVMSTRISMPEGTELRDVDVALADDQQEIEVELIESQMTTAMGGGLLWAIADAVVNHGMAEKGSKTIGQVRDALLDYDVNERLRLELASALRAAGISLEQTRFISLNDYEDTVFVVREETAQTVMLVKPYYALADFYRKLKLELDVTLFANDPGLIALLEADGRKEADAMILYRNNFRVLHSLGPDSKKMEENAPLLAEDGGSEVREALTRAIGEMAQMVVYDLSLSPGEIELEENLGHTEVVDEGIWLKGQVVREQADAVWFRTDLDTLCATIE